MMTDGEWEGRESRVTRRMMSDEVLQFVCERIEAGESVRSIFALNDLPARSAFYRFVAESEEAQDRYARAMELRQMLLFDEIIDIADTTKEGTTEKTDADGKILEIKRGDMIEHRKLQIEARKWALGKMNPEKYGNRTDLKVDGSLTIDSVAERLARAKERLKDED